MYNYVLASSLPSAILSPLGSCCDLYFFCSSFVDYSYPDFFPNDFKLSYSLSPDSPLEEVSVNDNVFVIKNPYTNKIASFSLEHNVVDDGNSSFDFSSSKIESSISNFLVKLAANIPAGFFHSYEKSFFSLSLKIEGYYDLK